MAGEQKEWLTTLLLCIFLGGFGAHRFYTGFTKEGVIQLLTCGGCLIWAIIDLINIITNKFVDAEGRPLLKA
jgi:TM2 domain-containing membrane protein YozV